MGNWIWQSNCAVIWNFFSIKFREEPWNIGMTEPFMSLSDISVVFQCICCRCWAQRVFTKPVYAGDYTRFLSVFLDNTSIDCLRIKRFEKCTGGMLFFAGRKSGPDWSWRWPVASRYSTINRWAIGCVGKNLIFSRLPWMQRCCTPDYIITVYKAFFFIATNLLYNIDHVN